MNIILSGFMGSGKSTIAKILADLIGYSFIDLDCYIEETSGLCISEIFAKYGEYKFRALEEEAVAKVSALVNTVIATGGGTIINSKNLEKLKSCGTIVFLDVTVDTVLKRLANDTKRPLLQHPNKKDAITELLMGRLPIYTTAADLTIDANSPNAHDTANDIINKLKLDKAAQ